MGKPARAPAPAPAPAPSPSPAPAPSVAVPRAVLELPAPDTGALGLPVARSPGLVLTAWGGPDGPTLAADPDELPECGGWDPSRYQEWEDEGRRRVAVPGLWGRIVAVRARWKLPGEGGYAPDGATPAAGWRRQAGLLLLGAVGGTTMKPIPPPAPIVEVQGYGLAGSALLELMSRRYQQARRATAAAGVRDVGALAWAVRAPGGPGLGDLVDTGRMNDQARRQAAGLLVPRLTWSGTAGGETEEQVAEALRELRRLREAVVPAWRAAWGAL